MLNDAFVGSLPVISYRIATEPDFIQKLKSLIEKRMLDSGQAISEDEASVLIAYLDTNQNQATPQRSSNKVPDPGQLETWIG